MAYWLVKSEPSVYSWDQLIKDKKTIWDGVRNYGARIHLNAMRKGDLVFYYHSNEGLEIVGIAKVVKEAFPDPTAKDNKGWVAVELSATEKLKQPVTLSEIKGTTLLQQMALVKNSRLSVQPVTIDEWNIILKMGGMN